MLVFVNFVLTIDQSGSSNLVKINNVFKIIVVNKLECLIKC